LVWVLWKSTKVFVLRSLMVKGKAARFVVQSRNTPVLISVQMRLCLAIFPYARLCDVFCN